MKLKFLTFYGLMVKTMKKKHSYLLRFIIGLVEISLIFYVFYHFNFINVIGYVILTTGLESIRPSLK